VTEAPGWIDTVPQVGTAKDVRVYVDVPEMAQDEARADSSEEWALYQLETASS